MFRNMSCFIAVISFMFSFKFVQLNLHSTEIVLCRSCGYDVASSKYIFSKSSPNAYNHFNDTLFNKDDVLVEVFLNNIFFHYPVIAFYHATCVGVGEWEDESSWYPGYRWRPCVCPECGAYIGWVFEPIYPDLVEPPKTFYGFILNSLISETFLNNLIKYPVSLTNL